MTAWVPMHSTELEAALAAERIYSRTLLQAIPTGVCTVDKQGRVVALNPEGERLLGWSEISCAGNDLHDLIGCRLEPGDSGSESCPIQQVINTGKPAWATHTRIRRRDGTTKPVEYKCLPLPNPRGLGAIFCFRDLSNQLQLEKDLLRLASMPEESPSPIVEFDVDANFIYANRIMMELLDQFGFGPEGFPAIFPAKVARIVRECFSSGKGIKGVEASAGGRQYEWTFFPVPEIGLLRGYGIDLTERKRAEQGLKQARDAAIEASRVKSEFLANVSHELRTPLNGIIGMTELTLDSELSRQQREYLGMVRESAGTLLSLINAILDFSKIEAGKLSLDPIAFALRQSLGEMLKPLALRAHQKGLELICEIQPEVPEALIGDPVRLGQILVNLVDNAIKFTDQGEVVVQVSKAEVEGSTDRIIGRHEDASATLHFAIQDTGIGIPEEKQCLIFDPFIQADGSTTRTHGGTGLGLAIVAQLVDMMAGNIWVESAGPGTGSTFHFTAHVGLQPEVATPSASLPADHRDLPVLVVDGNPTSRRVLTAMLQSFDLCPTTVDSASAALTTLAGVGNSRTPFALIVIDAHMPEMDGFELARRLKHQPEWANVPILMLTATGQQGGDESPETLGLAGCLSKPVLPADLASAITFALGASSSDSQHVSPAPPAMSLHKGKGLYILLAEDNVVNQKLVVCLLEKRGHKVVVANTGREVLALLPQQPFDLVLMDIQMPEMDGLETTAAIRAQEQSQGTHLPVVAMTAHAMHGDRERCLAAGMDAYLSKPLQSQELFETIDRLLQSVTTAESKAVAVAPDYVVFDQAELLARIDGDVELMQELIAIFLEDYPKRLTQLREALDCSDDETLAQAAHTLKGVVSNLCAPEAFATSLCLEETARSGDRQQASKAYATLEQTMARLQTVLVSVIAAPG
jgi:two-component system sensor histidine kinase/response regulator